jgi:hypothetical protein
MKPNALALYNRLRRDALVRNSDSPETLKNYAVKYFQVDLTPADASSIYKAIVTARDKARAIRQTSKEIEKVLVTV